VPALVTQNFRIHNSRQFFEMFDEGALVGGTATSNTAVSTAYQQTHIFSLEKQIHGRGHLMTPQYQTQVQTHIHLLIQQRIHHILIGRI